MATARNPSFIRTLQGDQFSIKLEIPRAFLNGRVPPQCGLQTRGRTWNVSVEKVNHKLYFQQGWKGFVQGNGLDCGEILVFRYAGNSQFHVEIFGANKCKGLRVMPEMEEANEHDDVSLEFLDDLSPCPRKIEEKSLLSSSVPHKRSKASSSGKADITINFHKRFLHLEKSAMKKKDAHWSKSKKISSSDNDSGDEDHHDENDYEDDDDEKEEDDDENEDDEEEETEGEEKEEEDDDSFETISDSPRCSRTVRKHTFASRLHQGKRKRYTAKPKSKGVGILSSEEKILRAIALQRACTFKFNSDNPCCVISMTSSYARGSYLNFPRSFAAEHLTNPRPSHITLRVDKRFWPANLIYIGTTTRIQAGWFKFARENNLKFGDACVFVLTNAIKFEYAVEIFRITDAV